jgi:hypothetical protein
MILTEQSGFFLNSIKRPIIVNEKCCFTSEVGYEFLFLRRISAFQKFSDHYLLTYSMEQSPSWEANLQLVKKFPAFFFFYGSSPHPQAHATCPYPEPTPSSPHNSLPFPEDH